VNESARAAARVGGTLGRAHATTAEIKTAIRNEPRLHADIGVMSAAEWSGGRRAAPFAGYADSLHLYLIPTFCPGDR
ncbi:MAG: hypothetical protein ACREJ4_07595, partial [Candidatus Methylomirabilaceae bacterium]